MTKPATQFCYSLYPPLIYNSSSKDQFGSSLIFLYFCLVIIHLNVTNYD